MKKSYGYTEKWFYIMELGLRKGYIKKWIRKKKYLALLGWEEEKKRAN